jgi:hypothetical protein
MGVNSANELLGEVRAFRPRLVVFLQKVHAHWKPRQYPSNASNHDVATHIEAFKEVTTALKELEVEMSIVEAI